jgi:hypothetical protein
VYCGSDLGIFKLNIQPNNPQQRSQIVELKEHQDGHAPYDAVLDGFVDSGRFLGQQASPE